MGETKEILSDPAFPCWRPDTFTVTSKPERTYTASEHASEGNDWNIYGPTSSGCWQIDRDGHNFCGGFATELEATAWLAGYKSPHEDTASEHAAALALFAQKVAEHVPHFNAFHTLLKCECGWEPSITADPNAYRDSTEQWQQHICSFADPSALAVHDEQVEEREFTAGIAVATLELHLGGTKQEHPALDEFRVMLAAHDEEYKKGVRQIILDPKLLDDLVLTRAAMRDWPTMQERILGRLAAQDKAK